jgi:hypothetical protein
MIAVGFDENVRREEVIGDLTSAEAFLYVCGGTVLNREGAEEDWPGLIAQSEDTLALGMTPEDWKKVWSVCGGNPHLLKVCVGYAKQYNSWDEGKTLPLVFLVLFDCFNQLISTVILLLIACLQG